jgi:hypothetical protein
VVSLEATYTKMINNVYYRNANLGAQTGQLAGGDNRPIYTPRLNSFVGAMNVLDNTNKGMSFTITPMIQKTFAKGLEASIAYTYTLAKDVAIGSSDQAGSGWTTNNIANNPNNPELGYSNYSVPHRIVAYGSYKFSYLHKQMSTTIGLYYSGQSQERYSYRYGGDVNNDGASNDTAQQQSDAFFSFIESDSYLKNHKGKVMDRYGATLPWVGTLDMRILQEFSVSAGGKKHTIQLSADISNVLNLLNKYWGYKYSYNFGAFQDQPVLGLASGFNRSDPHYTFNPAITQVYQPDYSTRSTWGIVLGARYIFN